MSGGFFRGTSADQDTRFSNKMKKLLKSQKFAPELDVVIDPTKVQMDVIKPWIATRATELLGFEDEVLINFIYGLLEVKNVDGKHVQIQLTGFMEKNTGRFMKELWGLLISAQSNLSGIPQQFLDIKAEETRLKKVESERIATELQRKKDQEKEVEEERQRERDAAAETARIARGAKADNDVDSKSSDERKTGRGIGSSRRSLSRDRSPPGRTYRRPQHSRRSSDSSLSRSPVRSPVRRRAISRSVSRSPRRHRRSLTPDWLVRVSRVVHSPVRRNFSPRHSRSPIRRRKSPPAYRSPPRHRYPSRSPPGRRSSRSPPLRRSPYRRNRSLSRDPPVARNGSDARREGTFRSPERVDRPRKSERPNSVSPDHNNSRSPPSKSLFASRQPTSHIVGERRMHTDSEERRTPMDRGGRGNVGDKRSQNDMDVRKVGDADRVGRDVVGEKRLYSDMEERKPGLDRAVRGKGDKWVHSGLDEGQLEVRRAMTDVTGGKRPYVDSESKAGADRSDGGEKRLHSDIDVRRTGVDRGGKSGSGEKRPYSDLNERKSVLDRENRQDNDMHGRKSAFERDTRFNSDVGERRSGFSRDKRQSVDIDERRSGFDRRDRPTVRERSPVSESRPTFKESLDTRRNIKRSKSPVEEDRRIQTVRPAITSDNDDSDSQKETLTEKSKSAEMKEVKVSQQDDVGSLSPRGTEERHKEEKRRRKEEKRQRREERHRRKREEKHKRKEEKRVMKAASKATNTNGEDKRESPEEMEQSDEEHHEYDQKRLEDALRQKALESLQAKKKAISH